MKLPVLFLLLLSTLPASAQRLDFAWFASVGGGLGTYDNGPFSRRLQMYTPSIAGQPLMYRTESFAYTGASLNASLGVLFGGNILVGVNGEKVFFPEIVSRNGSQVGQDRYALSASGGGLDLGYALVNDEGTIVYPFLHGGYYGYSLNYTNNQTDSIPFFEGAPIASGSTATYDGAAVRLGIGVGLTRYLGGIPGGTGVVVNARLMYGRMPARPEWKQNGAVVTNGGHTPEYNAVSLAVCVGFGTGK